MAHTAIAGAAAILILVLSLAASKPTPQIARAVPANDEWEPLATYMYESHVPIPPLPFPERGVQAQLAGDWISPESEPIALRLRGDGDLLRGRYQASGVAFAFEGQVGPGGGTLPWKGANGAKGEVTLRVLPDGDLEVEWTGAGISSGTARLVRKTD
jgi:hypothetical protein